METPWRSPGREVNTSIWQNGEKLLHWGLCERSDKVSGETPPIHEGERKDPAMTRATFSWRGLFFSEACKLTAQQALCPLHLKPMFYSLWSPHVITPTTAPHTYTHWKLDGISWRQAMAVLGVKFCLWGQWVRWALKQVESKPWGCESSPVTTEKGKNQSKHKLCKYLHKHGDSRIVEKSHSTAIQD